MEADGPIKKPAAGKRPVILAIGGYDPSSGAGITADIKTIAAHKCYGVTCITAMTVQSTRGVRRVEANDPSMISATLDELEFDMDIAAVKIGMIGSVETGRGLAAFLKRYPHQFVVLDPVLRSSSGAELLSLEGMEIVKYHLIPLADVITPNIDEAAALTGLPVTNLDEMAVAAGQLRRSGARNVIVTGGHLNPPTDLLSRGSGESPVILDGVKVETRSTHGTGCAFSTALACNLARGQKLADAAKAAKQFVESALRNPPGVGRAVGPVL